MNTIHQRVKRAHANGPSTDELASEIKSKITIFDLGRKFFPGWEPGRRCLSPFRIEENPSFSVSEDGRLFNDFTGDCSGDVFHFYQKATGCDQKTAFLELKAMLDGGTMPATGIQ